MDKVPVLLCFGGEWITNGSGSVEYVGGEERALRVDRNLSFDGLREKGFQLLNLDPLMHNVEIKFAATTSIGCVKYISVMDDDGVDCLLNHSSSMVPVYFTVSSRVLGVGCTEYPPFSRHCRNEHNAEGSHFAGSAGSNVGHHAVDQIEPTAIVFNSGDPLSDHCHEHDGVNEEHMTEAEDEQIDEQREGPHWQIDEQSNEQVNEQQGEQTLTCEENEDQADDLDVGTVEEPNDSDLHSLATFSSKGELQKCVQLTALQRKFEYRVHKSTPSLLVLCCARKEQCNWRLRAKKCNGNQMFMITRYKEKHTCMLHESHKWHRNASARVISGIVRHNFKDVGRKYGPKDIINDVQKDFGIILDYQTAWRAKWQAMDDVRGTHERAYCLLPSYCHQLELRNPGTVTAIETEEGSDRFLYFFMALGPCIQGFISSIRPVIAVDATSLTGTYRGTLLVATGLDGNNKCYPVAWGICDSENDASWHWFFLKLRLAIGDVQNLVIVSDQQDAIRTASYSVFPNSTYGNCILHLQENIKNRFKLGKNNYQLNEFCKAANSYHQDEFESHYNKLSDEVKKYLREDVGFPRWARLYCSISRYNIMATNIVESLNSMLKDAREHPIIDLVEFIRQRMQRWFYDRRLRAQTTNSILTPDFAENTLKARILEAANLQVLPITGDQFHVLDGKYNGQVDLNLRSCTCRQFQLDGIPCKHACAAAVHKSRNPFHLCSSYYLRETWLAAYAEAIQPVGEEATWIVPEEIRTRIVLPPPMRRCRKRRLKTSFEYKCSVCGQTGHNRGTCKETPLPTTSASTS